MGLFSIEPKRKKVDAYKEPKEEKYQESYAQMEEPKKEEEYSFE
jgi:hypothetical protein